MTLNQLNALSANEAMQWFEATCASENWCKRMELSRPFNSLSELKQTALQIWSGLSEKDFLQAFEAHPMIGDITSLRKKYANTSDVAQQEQSGTTSASETTLQELAEYNQQYLAKFGFIFIICATGLSAQNMLQALKKRINNPQSVEISNAAQQQINITLLRLDKGLNTNDNEETF